MTDGENNIETNLLDEPKSDKKKKKKKKNDKSKSKGVETMFRNAYRAQLDMLSLAATKANIMISLNGVIVSILMVTGGFIYANTPIFLIPAILFLITSAISIYFALTAASPAPAPAHTRVLCCLRDVIKGKAKLRDLKMYVQLPEQRFDKDTSNILVFEDFATLPRETYLEHMSTLLDNPDKIYEKMSDQLYRLGTIADQKYSMLRYSYSVFRWGLILSILVFLSLKAVQYYFPHDHEPTPTNISEEISIFKFGKIYEPSGVQQLPDGRILVIEDEPAQPLHILIPEKNNKMSENPALTRILSLEFKNSLNDLEAITTGPDGYLYASTSHKRNKKGIRNPDREQLLRFKIKGNKVVDLSIISNLHDAILEANILGQTDEQGKGGLFNLNIEALSFDKNKQLMIGLRNPQIDGKSVILLLENTLEAFQQNAEPVIAKTPILLDIPGGGLRAISYDPELSGYLISNEIFSQQNSNHKHAQILFWNGKTEHTPVPYKISALNQLDSIEGVAPVTINKKKSLLLVSDNGSLKENKAANYFLLDYEQLNME